MGYKFLVELEPEQDGEKFRIYRTLPGYRAEGLYEFNVLCYLPEMEPPLPLGQELLLKDDEALRFWLRGLFLRTTLCYHCVVALAEEIMEPTLEIYAERVQSKASSADGWNRVKPRVREEE